jgi:hypothetical protein
VSSRNGQRPRAARGARVPTSTNVAPPGWYMLFVVSDNGVPSVGRFIQIQ